MKQEEEEDCSPTGEGTVLYMKGLVVLGVD
jgi:hypothetical protein